MSKRFKSIPHEKLIHIPNYIQIPKDIPASEVLIPSKYAEGNVSYEDSHENLVDKDKATHLRFIGQDRKTDIVVGPIKPKGMIKLTLYLTDDNLPEIKEKATNSRSKILNEKYRAIN